jgi:hypothetical protein
MIELLRPPTAGASNGGDGASAGQDTAASGSSSGSGGRHAGGSAGSPPSQGGSAGAPQAGGGNGGAGSGGCFGPGCAGESGFGGSSGGPNCGNGVPCTCVTSTQCPKFAPHCSPLLGNVCVDCITKGPSECFSGFNCDVVAGRCAPSCDGPLDCTDGGVCDMNQGTCVWCIDDDECGRGDDPRRTCYLHRCVECTQNAQCANRGERRLCSGNRCVECSLNEDCTTPGKSHCDTFRGSCE